MGGTQTLLRFDDFELNLESEELRKGGTAVKLRPQAFRVLALLAIRAGQIVTREETRRQIWGEETYVDFEHGLNQCIKQIRDVLGDCSEKPVYVETIPRRGYRFLAEVTAKTMPAPGPKLIQSDSSVRPALGNDSKLPFATGTKAVGAAPSEVQDAAITPSVRIAETRETRVAKWKARWITVTVALFLIAALIGGGLYYRFRLSGHLTGKDTIVLADFANSTNDPAFDDTLKTALSVSLAQSPFLNELPQDKTEATLQLMVRPMNRAITPALARELCVRSGSKAYIAGSIASLGSEYVLGLKAVNCQNGDVLAQQQITAATKEKVLDALGQATAKLRGELGESLATVQKLDVPLAEATTSSLDALRAYSLSRSVYVAKGRGADLPYLERAIQLDPNFAMAYRAAAWDYRDLGDKQRSSEYYSRAFELREHASDRERLLIEADYYFWVVGDLDKAAQVYQELAETYPLDHYAYMGLGNVYSLQGDYEQSLVVYHQALRLAQDDVRVNEALAETLLELHHFDETRRVIHEAEARGQDHFVFRLVLYVLGFVEQNAPAMAEQEQWFAAHPKYTSLGLDLASDSKAYSGHLNEARALRKQALDSAARADQEGNGAIYLGDAAVLEAALGNAAQAEQTAAAGLKLAPTSQEVEVEAALAFAIAGQAARSESLAKDLNRRFPFDTQLQSLWLPAIRAQLALDRKEPTVALKALQVALPSIEFGNIVFISNGDCLYHTYIRGAAYLAAGQGSAAAAEFQKILDHSGIVGNCVTGALAHLGVARADALQAKNSQGSDADAARARALAAYQDFLLPWKDADPDIPIYKQAKLEYARLQ